MASCVQQQDAGTAARTLTGARTTSRRRRGLPRLPRRRETPLELAGAIADAYGLVLALIMATFIVMMTLPPEGWGGRVSAIAAAMLTSVIAFTSSTSADRESSSRS